MLNVRRKTWGEEVQGYSSGPGVIQSLDALRPSAIVKTMVAKPKPKKKEMALEDFALAIQTDLARTATTKDLKISPAIWR